VFDQFMQGGHQPIEFALGQRLTGLAVAVQRAGGFLDVGRDVSELDRHR
jgi:hypothetical protein